MIPLSAHVTVHTAAKLGNSSGEYEDACAMTGGSPSDEGFDARGWRCAVADGASESLLAGRWADLLVRTFAEAPASADPEHFADHVLRAADRWPDTVAGYVERREERGRPLQWYERPGLEQGALATLIALEVAVDVPESGPDNLNQARWRAIALGDSCLFQVRDEQVVGSFPVHESTAFGTSPHLVGSRDPDPGLLNRRVQAREGVLQQGDELFLGTDAFSCWFLSQYEKGLHPWKPLRELGALPDFTAWLTEQREQDLMNNDDVTLVHLQVW